MVSRRVVKAGETLLKSRKLSRQQKQRWRKLLGSIW